MSLEFDDLLPRVGKWQEFSMPMLEGVVPDGGALFVGWLSSGTLPGRRYAGDCFICGRGVSYAVKDPYVLDRPGIRILCVVCFLKLQPEDAA